MHLAADATPHQKGKSVKKAPFSLQLALPNTWTRWAAQFFERWYMLAMGVLVTILSIFAFNAYLHSGLGLAYNDARSHLDIGRRVVEGLKPGIAQLGSVWLPLPHLLMVPTIWQDFMWHSGLSGALQSMLAYIGTTLLVMKILKRLGVQPLGQIFGALIFATNLNIVYLQSTAMTELLLIGTMTAGTYELIKFHQNDKLVSLILAAFWIMLSTLVRYDGWFLLCWGGLLIAIYGFRQGGYQKAEGLFVLFGTVAGLGVVLWLLWNLLIFKDPLYFIFGPYSAHAQQDQLDAAGVLLTKHNIKLSLETYWYAMVYNIGILHIILAFIASWLLFFDKKIEFKTRLATTTLFAPLIFNILALYLGHSVLFVQNLNGDTWFNVRYGIMMIPSVAVLVGYLSDRVARYRMLIIGLVLFVNIFAFLNRDAVTIDDGRVGSSQKNVSEVSGWLYEHAGTQPGFVLISAASHDAIIFSSRLPMAKFIHEGTGKYWLSATTSPDRWATWIVMRTNDENDQTFKLVNKSHQLDKYDLVASYPFADIYQLKAEFLPNVATKAVYGKQK